MDNKDILVGRKTAQDRNGSRRSIFTQTGAFKKPHIQGAIDEKRNTFVYDLPYENCNVAWQQKIDATTNLFTNLEKL